ncbi:hypothetical protein ACQ859_28210 [Roseateles chitinivorans]|uniref:hypothetical protein n=1 Tax=Roseateles chitinivorans TaxID=2917965 RepID=UPI003D674C52
MSGFDQHIGRETRTSISGLEVEGDAEQIANSRANRHLRQIYAARAYGLAAGCIVLWAALLAIQGGIKATIGIEMWSDQVLIAVTTGVTVSVLAAFLGVIRGLFPGKDERAPAPP